ncbi:LOW QUALITY PROTEIN: sodium-dependent glucose transporter 1B-like [Psammomys obesus]|uniref:LOW QUALITY PROTEIN: sodium-dependent glucose transporter 1B-like n=1 Tax=Psammomys obesus TaxID=48139 RepID=UPI0024532032|nr:LOW QUALITY PROTEIN: sodium-dependent glucose transporter 1B-like [Psammomys obesus]
MMGGVLFGSINYFLLLGVSLSATTAGLYLMPFCRTAALLIVMMSVFGVSMGILDTGGNVLILDLWGDKGAPHMQALHFSFALGAVLAPLLAKLAWGTAASAHTESDFDPLMLNRPSEASTGSLFAPPDDMTLLWTYASIGTYVLVVSVFLFGLFCKKHSKQEKATASAQVARRGKYHRALLCLLFLFFFYVGTEVTYGSYVFSFETTHVGMEESEAAGLNSIFWGTFAACRGLAIFFATVLQPGTMIVLSNIGMSLASSFFLVLFDKNRLCLWIATSVYGASMAATFPSGISWVEQYTTLTRKSTAFFVIGAALGEMAIPAAIGILQGHYPGLPVVLYMGLGSAICTAVLFPVMYKLATLPLKRQRKGRRKSKDQKALLSSAELNDYEEENEEEDAEKWNKMDFEVVGMSDPVQESVSETPRGVAGSTTEVSHQFLSDPLGFESSSAGSSKSLVNHQNKRD